MKKLFSNVLLLLLSVAISILVCEGLIRLFVPQRLQDTPAMYAPDDYLIFKIKSQFSGTYASAEFVTPIVTNSLGLRNLEVGPKPQNGIRMVGLGDSFSFANGVDLAETYFKVFEKCLASTTARPVEVINCAVPAYSPLQDLRMLEKHGMSFDPDVVVMGFFVGNDFVESMDLFDENGAPLIAVEDGLLVSRKWSDKRNERGIIRPLTSSLRDFLSGHSHFYIFLRDRLSNVLSKLGLRPFNLPPEFCAKEFSPRMQQGWASTQTVLRNAASYVRQQNKRLVIVVLPVIYQVYRESWDEYIHALELDPESYDLDKPQTILAEFFQKEGIEMVDVLPELRKRSQEGLLFFPVDGHPTKEGHKIIGEVLCNYFLQNP